MLCEVLEEEEVGAPAVLSGSAASHTGGGAGGWKVPCGGECLTLALRVLYLAGGWGGGGAGINSQTPLGRGTALVRSHLHSLYSFHFEGRRLHVPRRCRQSLW